VLAAAIGPARLGPDAAQQRVERRRPPAEGAADGERGGLVDEGPHPQVGEQRLPGVDRLALEPIEQHRHRDRRPCRPEKARFFRLGPRQRRRRRAAGGDRPPRRGQPPRHRLRQRQAGAAHEDAVDPGDGVGQRQRRQRPHGIRPRELQRRVGGPVALRRDRPCLRPKLRVLRRHSGRRRGERRDVGRQRRRRAAAVLEPSGDEAGLPGGAALEDVEGPQRPVERHRPAVPREALAHPLREQGGQEARGRRAVARPRLRLRPEASEIGREPERRAAASRRRVGDGRRHLVEQPRRLGGAGDRAGRRRGQGGERRGPEPPLRPSAPDREKQDEQRRRDQPPAQGPPGRRRRLDRLQAVAQQPREVALRRARRLGRRQARRERRRRQRPDPRQVPPRRRPPRRAVERRVAAGARVEQRPETLPRRREVARRQSGAEARGLHRLGAGPRLAGDGRRVGGAAPRHLGGELGERARQRREPVVRRRSRRRTDHRGRGLRAHSAPSAAHSRSRPSPTSKCIESSRS